MESNESTGGRWDTSVAQDNDLWVRSKLRDHELYGPRIDEAREELEEMGLLPAVDTIGLWRLPIEQEEFVRDRLPVVCDKVAYLISMGQVSARELMHLACLRLDGISEEEEECFQTIFDGAYIYKKRRMLCPDLPATARALRGLGVVGALESGIVLSELLQDLSLEEADEIMRESVSSGKPAEARRLVVLADLALRQMGFTAGCAAHVMKRYLEGGKAFAGDKKSSEGYVAGLMALGWAWSDLPDARATGEQALLWGLNFFMTHQESIAEEDLEESEDLQDKVKHAYLLALAYLGYPRLLEVVDEIYHRQEDREKALPACVFGIDPNLLDGKTIRRLNRIYDRLRKGGSKCRHKELEPLKKELRSELMTSLERRFRSLTPGQVKEFIAHASLPDMLKQGYKHLMAVHDSGDWYPGVQCLGKLLPAKSLANGNDRADFDSGPVQALLASGVVKRMSASSDEVLFLHGNPLVLRDRTHNRSFVLPNGHCDDVLGNRKGVWLVKGAGLAYPYFAPEFNGLLGVPYLRNDPPYTLYGGLDKITAYASAGKAKMLHRCFDDVKERTVYQNCSLFACKKIEASNLFPSDYVHIKPVVVPVCTRPGAMQDPEVQSFLCEYEVRPPRDVKLPLGVHWVRADPLLERLGMPDDVRENQHILMYKVPSTHYRFADFKKNGYVRNQATKEYLEDIGYEVKEIEYAKRKRRTAENIFPQIEVTREGQPVSGIEAGIELAFDCMARVVTLLDYVHNVLETTGTNEYGSIFIAHNLGRHSFDPDTLFGEVTDEYIRDDVAAAQLSLSAFYSDLGLPNSVASVLNRAFLMLLIDEEQARDRILLEMYQSECPALVRFAVKKVQQKEDAGEETMPGAAFDISPELRQQQLARSA